MRKIKFTPRLLATMGVLIALEIVIAQFLTIRPTQSIKISLDFIPVVVAGILYGPIPAMIMSMLADILGAFLFPVGPFFPGFTATAALTGLLYGLTLHKSQSWLRVILAVAVQQWVLSLLLNTFWLKVLYGMPYLPTLVSRIPQCAILTAAQFILIPVVAKIVQTVGKKVRA